MANYSSVLILLNEPESTVRVEAILDAAGAEYLRTENIYFVGTEDKRTVSDLGRALGRDRILFCLVHIGTKRGSFVLASGLPHEELSQIREIINKDYNYGKLRKD